MRTEHRVQQHRQQATPRNTGKSRPSAYQSSVGSYQTYSNQKPRDQHPTTTMQKTASAYPASADSYKFSSKSTVCPPPSSRPPKDGPPDSLRQRRQIGHRAAGPRQASKGRVERPATHPFPLHENVHSAPLDGQQRHQIGPMSMPVAREQTGGHVDQGRHRCCGAPCRWFRESAKRPSSSLIVSHIFVKSSS